MTIQPHVRVSVEAFEMIAALPENEAKRLEFIGGEITEVVSNNFPSQIAALTMVEIGFYNKQHQLGYLTSADGGYTVSGERYMPEVGFISKTRQPKRSHNTWNALAPDLAVEVVPPSDRAKNMVVKVANYLAAGTLLWYVYPDEQEVNVYEPGKPVKTLGINDTLDGGAVLPGFKMTLNDIFPAD